MPRFKLMISSAVCIVAVFATAHAEYPGRRDPQWREAWRNTVTLAVYGVLEKNISDEREKPALKAWIHNLVVESEPYVEYVANREHTAEQAAEGLISKQIKFRVFRKTITRFEAGLIADHKALVEYQKKKNSDPAPVPHKAFREMYQTDPDGG